MAQRVVSPRLVLSGGVEIDGAALTTVGNTCRYALHEIAMRIDKREAVAIGGILQRHCFKQGGFACASFADDVDVREAIFSLDTENAIIVSEIDATDFKHM